MATNLTPTIPFARVHAYVRPVTGFGSISPEAPAAQNDGALADHGTRVSFETHHGAMSGVCSLHCLAQFMDAKMDTRIMAERSARSVTSLVYLEHP